MSLQVLAPAPLRDQFDHVASALSRRVHQTNDESRSLADLREVLLPKLISGALRVGDPVRFLGGGD
jgi:type I restriction enzyme S subunit